MQDFEAIRSHVGGLYPLQHNDPYLISLDLMLGSGRRQGIYLAEMEEENGRRHLRVSTPISPMDHTDAHRCLRFNWEQRVGFLAISDLDNVPYLHLCENQPYPSLDAQNLQQLILELGTLGDHLEQLLGQGTDAS